MIPKALPNRILFIDAARGLAVLFALFVHALYSFRVWSTLDIIARRQILFITECAFPCFILLFGMMLEWVYYEKLLKEGSFKSIRPRLFKRSLLCYLAYLAAVASDLVMGRASILESLGNCLFLDQSHLSAVLKFWTVALILAIPVLWIRRRYGLAKTFFMSLSLWCFVPFLDFIPWPDQSNPLSYWTALFFGKPINRSLFSLLHSLVFIMTGMILGRAVSDGMCQGSLKSFQKTTGWILGFSVILIGVIMFVLTPRSVLVGFTTVFRKEHHLAYYIMGLFEACAALLILSWLLPLKEGFSKILSPLLIFGKHSLFTFAIGNVLLRLWPHKIQLNLPLGLVAYLSLVVLLVMLIRIREKAVFFSFVSVKEKRDTVSETKIFETSQRV